jgi:hypothetical protein
MVLIIDEGIVTRPYIQLAKYLTSKMVTTNN